MATTRKTTSTRKKTTAKTATNSELNSAPVVKNSVVKEESTPVQKKKSIPQDEMITVRNNTRGGLNFSSQVAGAIPYYWSEQDDIQIMTFKDLSFIRATAPRFFTENWVVVEDTEDGLFTRDDIYEALRVQKYYDICYDSSNIFGFFDLSAKEMASQLAKVSRGEKELIISTAQDLYKSGDLFDVRKIRTIEKALGQQVFYND